MSFRVLATGVALAVVVSMAGTASAQTSPGAFSITATGSWDPSIGGTMHEGGSGSVLGLATLVDEKSWTETHTRSGFAASAGFGVGLNNMVEAVGNVEFGQNGAQELQVGTVATLPLFAEFDDYQYWGLNGGVRVLMGSGNAVPYVTGTFGFRQISEITGVFSVPAASVTLSQPFFESSMVPTFGADFGVLYGGMRAKIGFQVGVHWAGGPEGAEASFAGTGLENLNDKGARWSLPVGVVVRF
jgi:hypothetical protein